MSLNDEMYDVIDIEDAINQKKELITKAKELSENETRDLTKAATNLRRRWRRIPYWESLAEDQLAQEFDSYINIIFNRRHLVLENNKNAKLALIETVNNLGAEKPVKEADEALDAWKKIGTCGKEDDEALWQEFSAARRNFYERKRARWEDMKEHYEESRAIKEDIVKQAQEILARGDYFSDSSKYDELLVKWKEARYCGDQQIEEDLWNAFCDARREFFKRRREHFNDQRIKQKEASTTKNALLEEARSILEKDRKSREDTQRMKDIGREWKEAGYTGKKKEEKLWKEYREVMDAYFGEMRENSAARQQRQADRVSDLKARKNDQILSLRRQIERLRQEALETLSEREANEIAEEIADKEDYIAELLEDIAELENA